MRLKRSRLKTHWIRPRTITKDNEGVPVESYGNAFSVDAEVWPAGGKVQAKVYGERLAYICNCRVKGDYRIEMQDGSMVYRLNSGSLKEQDGFHVHTLKDQRPDYRIIAIKPYKPLYMELERMS